jgi:hypothetical protein
MEQKIINTALLTGWGIDSDPIDQPNYPIKHYTGDDHSRKNWQRPTQQAANVEILMSIERPYISAVFGTKLPPKGLSGALRRFAFKYSENMYRHWLPLLMADRIDTIESAFGDLFHGRFPRVFRERGWRALWKFKPGVVIRKIIVRLVVLAAIVALIVYLIQKNKY